MNFVTFLKITNYTKCTHHKHIPQCLSEQNIRVLYFKKYKDIFIYPSK